MIIVNTNTESLDKANRFEEYLREQEVDTIFEKTLLKNFVMNNEKIQKSFSR